MILEPTLANRAKADREQSRALKLLPAGVPYFFFPWSCGTVTIAVHVAVFPA